MAEILQNMLRGVSSTGYHWGEPDTNDPQGVPTICVVLAGGNGVDTVFLRNGLWGDSSNLRDARPVSYNGSPDKKK